MHRYRDNKGRFVSSKDSKSNPQLIQLTLVQEKFHQEKVQEEPTRLQKKNLKRKNQYWGRQNVSLLKETHKTQFLNHPLVEEEHLVKWQNKKEMQPLKLRPLVSNLGYFQKHQHEKHPTIIVTHFQRYVK